MITEQLLANAYSYVDYKLFLEELLARGKTTGSNQSSEYINYTKLNLLRMNRIEKTCSLSDEINDVISQIKSNYIWLIITEGWCGDAAQNIPVLFLISKLSPSIELKLILRDEYPEIMNLYLTNTSRSIPKLICLEKNNLKEVFTWGPRPAILQTRVIDFLKKGGTSEEKGLMVQNWYNADKTKSLQHEIYMLMQKLS